VTHANESILINLSAEGASVNLELFSIRTGHAVARNVETRRRVLFNDGVKADPKNGNRISATILPAAAANRYSCDHDRWKVRS